MTLKDRLSALDDRALGPRPTAEPLASLHRRLWGLVLLLLVGAAVTGGVGLQWLAGDLCGVALGVAVSAVLTARASRRL